MKSRRPSETSVSDGLRLFIKWLQNPIRMLREDRCLSEDLVCCTQGRGVLQGAQAGADLPLGGAEQIELGRMGQPQADQAGDVGLDKYDGSRNVEVGRQHFLFDARAQGGGEHGVPHFKVAVHQLDDGFVLFGMFAF